MAHLRSREQGASLVCIPSSPGTSDRASGCRYETIAVAAEARRASLRASSKEAAVPEGASFLRRSCPGALLAQGGVSPEW